MTFSELEKVYDGLLQTCRSLNPLRQIHSSLVTWGLTVQSPHLSAQIIIKYSKLGDIKSARSLFDNIHGHRSFMWNTMLRAYANGSHSSETLQLYSLMRKTGIVPNNYAYPFALKACASHSSSLHLVKAIHGDAIRTGFDSDRFFEAALLDTYAKCGQIEDARILFDKMTTRDLVCWTAMITAYDHAEQPQESLLLFLEMLRKEGLFIDPVATVTLASAVGQLGDGKRARSIHSQAIRRGFIFEHTFVANSIIGVYAKCGKVEKARLVFEGMKVRDIISWNSMLSAYTQNGQATESLLLFHQMQTSKYEPNSVTVLTMVSTCAYLGSRHLARRIHDFVIHNKITIDATLLNALIDMYAKCGALDTAVEIFNKIQPPDRSVCTWNALIGGYGMHGRGTEALQLFQYMQEEESIKPNHITFTSILSACSHSGLINEGKQCFKDMKKLSIKPDMKHYACMVDMLGRTGLLTEAYNLIKEMPLEPNDEVWGALLLACRIHGNTKLGEIAATRLFQLKPEHSGYYVLMSNIYAASSKWKEVRRLREGMKSKGLTKVAALSMVELGEEVHGFHTADWSNLYSLEAQRKAESMMVEMRMVGYVPDRSCVLHDVEDEDKDHILNYHSEKLAVAFGIMKINPKMDIRVTKNLRICNDCHCAFKYVSYIYNRRIIVRDANRFHHFENGSCSCSDYW